MSMQKRETILFVVPRFHTNLFFATKALKEAGYSVAVFAASDQGREDHSVVVPQVFGRAPAERDVAKAFAALSPDLVLVRYAWDLSARVKTLCRRHAVPLWAYTLVPATKRRTWRQRLGALRRLERPERRVTPVPGLDRTAPMDRHVRYLPWPVEADTVPAARTADGPLRILCVGRLSQRRKNHHLLVEAVDRAGLAGRVSVTLVGGSRHEGEAEYLDSLREMAASRPWLEIEADLPFSEMGRRYAAADVCVMPSVGEILGVAPLEAMAYGAVPVISLEAGSAGYITHDVDGLRIDLQDHGDLPRALRRLADDPEMVGRLSRGALETAGTELSPQRFVARIEALLAEG